MLSMFLSILPILIATSFMLCKKDATKSLFIGFCFGLAIFIFFNGFSLENFIKIYNVLTTTTFENISVLLSIFLLLFLVFLIKNSNIIFILNFLTERYINTHIKVIIFLLIFGIIFSLDDYLLCIATAMILNDIAQKHGFSKEKNTFLINITSVCCCCLSPFSSWMPVIKHTLVISGLHETDIYYIFPYNFTALFGIILVIIVGTFKQTAFNSTHVRLVSKSQLQPCQLTSKYKLQLYSFFILFIILFGSLFLMTFVFQCSNAVIISSLISIFIAVPIFLLTNAINKTNILKSLYESMKSTWELGKLLILIWLLSSICKNLLNMDRSIVTLTDLALIPTAFLPLIVYLISGMFAFLTGSSYGTFGLFIPIAVQLTQNVNSKIQIITIASALSGSLLASFSMTSDTLKLTIENTNGNIDYIRFAQLPYGIILYLVSASSTAKNK